MSTYTHYTPTTAISKAMFNFDAFGWQDYRIAGTVRVSVSDGFSFADCYLDPNYSSFNSGLYMIGPDMYYAEIPWTSLNYDNIQDVLRIYSEFADINFDWRGDYDTFASGTDSTPNPEDVGRAFLSDINIALVYRSDVNFAGISGGSSDSILGYTGAAGDIFLNLYAPKFYGDGSLDLNTRGRQVLMHELGHCLGLSHPHSSYSYDSGAIITRDYAATQHLGFDQLGFHINSATDMYKEYFTIMSYDDQWSLAPDSNIICHAHTPMILDVIALQQVYGEGEGTSGFGDDTILAGTAGYRTYFDKGGTDTIDLSIYSDWPYDDGAYLNMGVDITGAEHMVGVSMSWADAFGTVINGDDPEHLRWFYGEYENALGSSKADFIWGNSLDNIISGQAGDDAIGGGEGNDTLLGGSGNDTLVGGDGIDTVIAGIVPQCQFSQSQGDAIMTGPEGTDTLQEVEYVRFGSGIYTTDVPLSDALTDNPLHLANRIADLYVAYFNRAPDTEGFDFWFRDVYTGAKGLSAIAEDFSRSNEYQSTYPSSSTNREFVEQVYQNLFDRAPDQEGCDFWTGHLDAGHLQRSSFILTVIEGAYSPSSGPCDRTLIDNKHDVALYYTGEMVTNPQKGYDDAIMALMNLVNGQENTVGAAERVIDYAFDNPLTLTDVMANEALFDSLWMVG